MRCIEYQAKVIALEHKALIRSHERFSFREDMIGEAFYVNVARKKVILCNFGYAKIRSDMRRFVRVLLDWPLEADMIVEEDILKGSVKNLSLGGASIDIASKEQLPSGIDINIILKLPDISSGSIHEVGVTATVIKVTGDNAPYTCIVEFYPEKHSQQQISYYINQRQVEIIKELKEQTL
ncbi:MAG: PilZ domain-containing protein [Oryzomonas sp.]